MTANTSKIPTGYKQTEIGMIPADWTISKLGVYGRFKGGNGFPLRYQGCRDDKYPFYKVSDMNNKGNETFMKSSNNYINEGIKKKINALIFPKNTIVFAKIGAAIYLERKKILSTESCIDNNMMGFIFDEEQLNYRFLHYLFLNTSLGKLVSATALPSLNGSQIADLVYTFPKLEEQSAIASALSDTDSLIEKLEKLIEKKKNIKQGAMQELLTGKKRLAGFSGKWESKVLGDLLDYEQPTKYIVKSTEYSDKNNIPVLTAGKSFILGYTNEEFNVFKNLPVIIFDDFTTATQFVDFSFKVKSSAMKILKPKNKDVDLRFAFEKMRLIDFKLGDHKRYWISEYRNIEVDVPKPKEQTAIANVLSEMNSEIEKLESQLAKYQNIKQGMMQTLLTGKIRLITK